MAKLQIKANLAFFQDHVGALKWGYLSPIQTKEECLVQYLVRIFTQPVKTILLAPI